MREKVGKKYIYVQYKYSADEHKYKCMYKRVLIIQRFKWVVSAAVLLSVSSIYLCNVYEYMLCIACILGHKQQRIIWRILVSDVFMFAARQAENHTLLNI